MCVIAGYIGNEQAAPVLLEMLRREEGLAAGFYTGIVTLHEGVLYHEKVVGDLDTLLRETDALNLPGTIGLVHGRTPSGGGRAWAHPFLDSSGKLAYIANGAMGLYRERSDFTVAAHRILERGGGFSSTEESAVANYPVLPDGRCVHFSDIYAQSIAADYEDGGPGPDRLLNAACTTYQNLPGELVGLCLHTDYPDEIVAVRHNKPIDIGRAPDGSMVMASTRAAFPPGTEWAMRLPGLCGARIERSGRISVTPFTRPDLIPVGPMPSAVEIERVLVGALRQAGSMTSPDFVDTAKPLWPEGVLIEKEHVAFDLIRALRAEGRIAVHDERIPGMEGKGTVPRTVLTWKG